MGGSKGEGEIERDRHKQTNKEDSVKQWEEAIELNSDSFEQTDRQTDRPTVRQRKIERKKDRGEIILIFHSFIQINRFHKIATYQWYCIYKEGERQRQSVREEREREREREEEDRKRLKSLQN